MPDPGVRSFLLFAAGMFAVLNGPLWVSVRARVFAAGPQAPVWLTQEVTWASRLAGVAMLGTWAWDAIGGLQGTVLMWLVLSLGLFFLLNGPLRLVTAVGLFRRGREAPAWMERATTWSVRLLGAVALVAALAVGIRSAAG